MKQLNGRDGNEFEQDKKRENNCQVMLTLKKEEIVVITTSHRGSYTSKEQKVSAN
jgi:hypothetical protein